MVTTRAVLLALLLIPANAWWLVRMEVTRYAGHPTTTSLFFNAVFWLALLLAINALVRRFAPARAWAGGELLTVYILLALASGIAGHDSIEVLTPILSHATRYATPGNGWSDTILPHVPVWLTVQQTRPLEEFYSGTGSLYDIANLRAWAGPVLCWTGLFGVMGWVMLCLNTLLRRQWTEAERLAYPLVSLPLEMASERTTLFRNPLFWLGAGVAATLQLWNGIAFLYPSLPMLPLKNTGGATDLATYVTQRPWNAIGWTPIAVYPFGVALGMLLPVDLLFSSWLFAWVWRLQRVAGVAFALNTIPNFPFVEEQSFGAYMGIALWALWAGRKQFGEIARGVLESSRVAPLGDENEPLPYRVAALGLLGGGIALFVFCRLCGMAPGLIAAFFGIYFLLSIAITRMRAEFGPPAHDLHRAGPDSMLPVLVPPGQLGRSDLAMFSLFYGFNRAYRGHPMPIQLEGFKIAEQVAAPSRSRAAYTPLLWAMLLVTVWGALCGFWAVLDQGYRFGASARVAPPGVLLIFGGEPWSRMKNWISSPPTNIQQNYSRTAVLVGFAFTVLLNLVRVRVGGFPLHPVGYAVSGSWSLSLLWLPLLVAWAIKVTLLRYGGLAAYRRFLPLFLGVIVGECVMGSLWTLIGIWADIPTYAFWP